MSELDELKQKIADLEARSNNANKGTDDPANKLRRLVDNFLQPPPEFKRGEVVRWKPGLKNKKYPKEDQIAMVIQQLEKPVVESERDSGSPYFNEPLDLVLGVLDDDGDLMVFHYDKRRFELAT
jgi:hypothetical protein